MNTQADSTVEVLLGVRHYCGLLAYQDIQGLVLKNGSGNANLTSAFIKPINSSHHPSNSAVYQCWEGVSVRFTDEWNLYNPFCHQLDRKLVTCCHFPLTRSEATDLATDLMLIQQIVSVSIIIFLMSLWCWKRKFQELLACTVQYITWGYHSLKKNSLRVISVKMKELLVGLFIMAVLMRSF